MTQTDNKKSVSAKEEVTEKNPVDKKASKEKKTEKKTENKVEGKSGKKAKQPVEAKPAAEPVAEPVAKQSAEKKQTTEDKFEEQLGSFQSDYEQLKNLFKTFATNFKKLESTHKSEVKKAKVARKSERAKNHKPTGFAKKRPVTGKLAKFISVESGTELPGPEITEKVWAELKKRNLLFENDKRVLRVDKEVSELFGLPMSVNESVDYEDPNGLNFKNLQKYIKFASDAGKEAVTDAEVVQKKAEATPKKAEKVATK